MRNRCRTACLCLNSVHLPVSCVYASYIFTYIYKPVSTAVFACKKHEWQTALCRHVTAHFASLLSAWPVSPKLVVSSNFHDILMYFSHCLPMAYCRDNSSIGPMMSPIISEGSKPTFNFTATPAIPAHPLMQALALSW